MRERVKRKGIFVHHFLLLSTKKKKPISLIYLSLTLRVKKENCAPLFSNYSNAAFALSSQCPDVKKKTVAPTSLTPLLALFLFATHLPSHLSCS